MSEFKSSNFRNEDGSGGPDIVGVTTFTSPYYFVPPSGTTAQRPSDPAPGMLRFNEDIGRLEVWRNDHWATILGESPNLGNQNAAAGESAAGTGARGMWGGRATPAQSNIVDYVTIATLGNAIDFGDMSSAKYTYGRASSRTRGLFAGGFPGIGAAQAIDFFTFSSTGNFTNFGNLTNSRWLMAGGCSNGVRGVFGGGGDFPSPYPASEIMDYVTIAQTGNAVDFGNLVTARKEVCSVSSPTRGLWAGGYTPANTNQIDYITISSTGNALDFGDCVGDLRESSGDGNATRGIFFGDSPGTSVIQFVTLASTGNAQDFGDLTAGRSHCGACASSTRGLVGGGLSTVQTIEYVTIATTGNAAVFGDLTDGGHLPNAMSNDHGGL